MFLIFQVYLFENIRFIFLHVVQFIMFIVSIQCTDSKIIVYVKTNRHFHGRIYALGRSETCHANVLNSNQFRLDLSLSGQDCNTQSMVSDKCFNCANIYIFNLQIDFINIRIYICHNFMYVAMWRRYELEFIVHVSNLR